jgi:hypothetical protein
MTGLFASKHAFSLAGADMGHRGGYESEVFREWSTAQDPASKERLEVKLAIIEFSRTVREKRLRTMSVD